MNGGDVVLRCHRAFHDNAKRHLPTIFGKCGHAQRYASIGGQLIPDRITNGRAKGFFGLRSGSEGQHQ
jgi:hypothetical protein